MLKPCKMMVCCLDVCAVLSCKPPSPAAQAGPAYCLRSARRCSAARVRCWAVCPGVLGYDASGTGFWLVHSAPRFPVSPDVSAYDGAPLPFVCSTQLAKRNLLPLF